ncbi:MAG: GTPase, partial [Clostridia bacterium]
MADTIAAVATAPAVSAIGIIRLSGQDALAIAKRVFFASLDLAARPREMIYGKITDTSGTLLDSGLAVYMKAPASYTGEDTVEFFSHGSPIVIREIMAALCRAGARSALPGEYTRRAFLNKKMDLTQAEAVIDLIDSETVAAARNAAAQMQGGMGKKITASRDKLLDIAASFYAYVDYPDEEIDELECNSMIDILTTVAKELVCLADSFNTGRILKSGVRCAIIGRPNAGKSSVLNELLGFERSIVSPIAGTTRDTVEES